MEKQILVLQRGKNEEGLSHLPHRTQSWRTGFTPKVAIAHVTPNTVLLGEMQADVPD